MTTQPTNPVMLDQSINPTDLYQALLAQYPYDPKKSAAANQTAKLTWAKAINTQLGYDPMNYQAPSEKAWVDPTSKVEGQYAKDPLAMAALKDIKDGQSSNNIAAQLIDPATGEVTPVAKNAGYSTAEATTAIKAAQDYEKEQADFAAQKQDYLNKQAADPTYARNPGSTGGKQVLPEGDINGWTTPSLQYSQGLMDMVNNLPGTGQNLGDVVHGFSNYLGQAKPLESDTMVPTVKTNPQNQLAARASGGFLGGVSPIQYKQGTALRPAPRPAPAQQGGLRSVNNNQVGSYLSMLQNKYAQNAAPQRSAANQAATGQLLQLLALQKGT